MSDGQKLDELVKVKKLREDDAIAALKKAQLELDARIEEEQARQRTLDEFAAWRPGEEQRIYSEIEGKPVPRSRLDEVREDIAALRLKELQLQENVDAAKQDRENAEAAVEEAREHRQMAWREVERFEEVRDQLRAEEAREEDRREESELDDILAGYRGQTGR